MPNHNTLSDGGRGEILADILQMTSIVMGVDGRQAHHGSGRERGDSPLLGAHLADGVDAEIMVGMVASPGRLGIGWRCEDTPWGGLASPGAIQAAISG